jgi:hypothetical protein
MRAAILLRDVRVMQEVFHVGEQGIYMLSFVHHRGSKGQLDIKPP